MLDIVLSHLLPDESLLLGPAAEGDTQATSLLFPRVDGLDKELLPEAARVAVDGNFAASHQALRAVNRLLQHLRSGSAAVQQQQDLSHS